MQEDATCDLGGDGGGGWGPEAFTGGRLQGENVGGSWVEAHEQVMGLVTQLEDLSPLGGQVRAGV